MFAKSQSESGAFLLFRLPDELPSSLPLVAFFKLDVFVGISSPSSRCILLRSGAGKCFSTRV
jgi:hypothetical protein